MKIESCPFCKNNEKGKVFLSDDSSDQALAENGSLEVVYWVECGGCEAMGPYRSTPEEAVEIWNKAKR